MTSTLFDTATIIVRPNWAGVLEAAPEGEYGFGTIGTANPDEAMAAARIAAERAGYADKYDLSAGWLDSISVRASSTVRFPAR